MKKVGSVSVNRLAGFLEVALKDTKDEDSGQVAIVEKTLEKGEKKEKLDFGDIDDIVPDDDDDDDDDDDEDEEEYMQEILEVATDDRAALVDGRFIFHRDPTDPEKLLMVARIDEFLPPDFNIDGDEMWIGEMIIRMRKGKQGAMRKSKAPSPLVFKKSNYIAKIE